MRILVVDDDDLAHEMAKRWLHEHDVTYAKSLEDAELAIADEAPELILCDVNIPPHEPGEVAENLAGRGIPVLKISVLVDGGIVEKSVVAMRTAVAAIADRLRRECIERAHCAISCLEVRVGDKGTEMRLTSGN